MRTTCVSLLFRTYCGDLCFTESMGSSVKDLREANSDNERLRHAVACLGMLAGFLYLPYINYHAFYTPHFLSTSGWLQSITTHVGHMQPEAHNLIPVGCTVLLNGSPRSVDHNILISLCPILYRYVHMYMYISPYSYPYHPQVYPRYMIMRPS